MAVSGVSYGGYIATKMLSEQFDNLLTCGVAVSPVVDWRFYGNYMVLKVSKFRKQIMVSKLLPKNKPNSFSWKITTSRLIQKESLSSFCKKIDSLLY